jgi:hypothetical protein
MGLPLVLIAVGLGLLVLTAWLYRTYNGSD